MKPRRSLFERITGSSSSRPVSHREEEPTTNTEETSPWVEETVADAQLTVDTYQTPSEIVLQAIVAGVRPEDLDINISRDMVTIKGTRHKHHEVREDDYFSMELYWGSFSRTILLPQEIEVEKSEAAMKNGLLTIRMPKINKEKSQSLKVKLL